MCIITGIFSKRQKEVYNAVNRVKNEATKMLVPGTIWADYHVEVGKLMTSELIGLGLLDKADVQNDQANRCSKEPQQAFVASNNLIT